MRMNKIKVGHFEGGVNIESHTGRLYIPAEFMLALANDLTHHYEVVRETRTQELTDEIARLRDTLVEDIAHISSKTAALEGLRKL